jgi:DNA polymerase IIIc chi subunit
LSVTFYGVVDPFEKHLSKLVAKVYSAKKRCHIICRDNDQMKIISKSLWTSIQKEFLPNGFDANEDPLLYPIWLSMDSSNKNNSDVVISVNEEVIKNTNDYSKIIDFYTLKDNKGKSKNRIYEYSKNFNDIASWTIDESLKWQKEVVNL